MTACDFQAIQRILTDQNHNLLKVLTVRHMLVMVQKIEVHSEKTVQYQQEISLYQMGEAHMRQIVEDLMPKIRHLPVSRMILILMEPRVNSAVKEGLIQAAEDLTHLMIGILMARQIMYKTETFMVLEMDPGMGREINLFPKTTTFMAPIDSSVSKNKPHRNRRILMALEVRLSLP